MHSYGTTCPRKNAITLEPLGLDFFLFSLSRSNDDLHFFYTWSCRRINPHGATVSFSLLGTLTFPHMCHVKTGFFKNRKKYLIFLQVPSDSFVGAATELCHLAYGERNVRTRTGHGIHNRSDFFTKRTGILLFNRADSFRKTWVWIRGNTSWIAIFHLEFSEPVWCTLLRANEWYSSSGFSQF